MRVKSATSCPMSGIPVQPGLSQPPLNTPTVLPKGNAARLFANGFICCQCIGLSTRRACHDAITEMNPLSGVLFTSCLDWVCVVIEHRESGGYRTGRGGEQGDVSPKKETKKEPHNVWLFIQTNGSAQGRPAGLVATLLAAVLPPWRPEVTTSLRTRGAYSTGARGVGAGAAAGVAMGA